MNLFENHEKIPALGEELYKYHNEFFQILYGKMIGDADYKKYGLSHIAQQAINAFVRYVPQRWSAAITQHYGTVE